MYCSRCGSGLQPTEQVCPRCGQPVAWPPPAQGGYAQPGYYPPQYRNQVNGGMILTLGILSILLCNILGPFAWIMGNSAVAAIDRGEADPSQRGSVNAGRICGIIGTVFILFGILLTAALVASPEFRQGFTQGFNKSYNSSSRGY